MMKAMTPSGSMFTSFSSPKGAKSNNVGQQLVAGMDISSWATVEVTGVQPGPLGILLDGNCPDGAVLDDFAPISSDGPKGTIELDGRVAIGSVLIAVNEFDLLEHKLSLQEVGRVLRDTSHLVRTLYFKVPPSRESIEASSASSVGEVDNRVLLKGVDRSSYTDKTATDAADPNKRAWNFKSLLSPSQIASSVAALSGFGASPVASPTTAPTPSVPQHEMPSAAPLPPSPTIPLRPASPTLSSSKSLYAATMLAVQIPPGPIGLNLDGSITDRAVVLGFLPLPDGSTGVLEQRGEVVPGAVLVSINGSSVTHLTLDDIRARLGALAGFERELVFELPALDPLDDPYRVLTAKDRAAIFNRLSDLDKRRKMELGLVLRYDKSTIKRHECWLLIDAVWMMRWVEFTGKGGVNPGPITNHVLLEHDWEARLNGIAKGRPDAPRAGLELMKHYRCVTPMVWAILAEFHGANNVPVQARCEGLRIS
jgi:hypothetical protein